jgi:flavin-dependent dehydrogenase
MLYDLIVVGGGPAGCATAISAARSGASVLLLERGRFPRHKVCGEFVSAESLELLNDLLSPPHHQRREFQMVEFLLMGWSYRCKSIRRQLV